MSKNTSRIQNPLSLLLSRKYVLLFLLLAVTSSISVFYISYKVSNHNEHVQGPIVHVQFSNRSHKDPPNWNRSSLECIGWARTADCLPTGKVQSIIPCNQTIPSKEAGYCVVKDANTGEEWNIMKKTCRAHHKNALKCDKAVEFANYSTELEKFKEFIPTSTERGMKGIIFAVKEGHLRETFAILKHLRQVGCVLPVEVWFNAEEMKADHPELLNLETRFQDVTIRECKDTRISKYLIKPYAVIHSYFDEVLLLDPDSLAVRDPTSLFYEEKYNLTGALFWPDFWQPRNTIFDVYEDSLFWELLDLPFIDMFEQESGQVLINRIRHKNALQALLYFITEPHGFLTKFDFVFGDKDLFRLAWLSTNATFHMIQRPPGAVGNQLRDPNIFCGGTIVQYHPNKKDLAFLHRNTMKHVEKGYLSSWELIQEYAEGLDPKDFVDFNFVSGGVANSRCCWGFHDTSKMGKRYTLKKLDSTLIRLEEEYIRSLQLYDAEWKKLDVQEVYEGVDEEDIFVFLPYVF